MVFVLIAEYATSVPIAAHRYATGHALVALVLRLFRLRIGLILFLTSCFLYSSATRLFVCERGS